MSSPWTAPGAPGPGGRPPEHDPAAAGPDGPGTGGAPGGTGAALPPSAAPVQRELVQSTPLFPLRPLGVGEVLGAAVRIYRLRARTVLGLAAVVYAITFVILTFTTGASLVPFVGDIQATIEDPDAPVGGLNTLSDVLLQVVSYLITLLVSVLASALVTVALTRVALGEAVGEHVSTGAMWATVRRRALPAIGVSLLIGAAAMLLFLVVLGLGALPLLLVQEPSVLTIVPLVLGLLAAVLAALWVWARTILSIPTLVIEETGVLGALRRSFALTRGRRLWRVLGLGVLVYVLYLIATQVITGVFSTIAFVVYLAIILVSLEAIVAGMIVMTVIIMIGGFAASFLLAPFYSAGFVAIYADARMRHEAWDVELTGRARAAWNGTGPR